jgi:hypothetical protein
MTSSGMPSSTAIRAARRPRLRRDAGPQGLDEADGVPQVGAHPHLGHRDRDVGQGRVGQIFLAQDIDQGVADQLAGAQLALRRTHGPAFLVSAFSSWRFMARNP